MVYGGELCPALAKRNVKLLSDRIDKIRLQARTDKFRLTQHAHQEMVEESITLEEVLDAIDTGQIIEHYPEHRRGACGLLNGTTHGGRSIHIVCTTAHPILIIITVYEPKPPKWPTSTQRSRR